MSFGILQTFLTRLTEKHNIENFPELNTIFRQFQVRDETFETIEYNINEYERPPMITVEKYRKKFGRSEKKK